MTRVVHEVAHHFDSAEQEFDACKLGMWLFLVTEIMLFGGLLFAYAVFRWWYPQMWLDFSRYVLDWRLGGINTVVLILSSFTMVMGVYCAQTDNQKWLKRNLLLTIGLAGCFMVIKYFEYKAKFDHHAVPHTRQSYAEVGLKDFTMAPHDGSHEEEKIDYKLPDGTVVQKTKTEIINDHHEKQGAPTNIFMGLYFTMTGIHGFHVLVGMGLLAWMYFRSCAGHFYPGYYTPVEMVGLYWHIVDVIWIFLFPLFYLVG